jgi:hypothetical protein
LPLQAAEREAFQAEVASFSPPEREVVMEFVTSWEREGRIKGREEGLVEGQRLLVERMLTRKLGPLTPDLAEHLGILSSSQLIALGEALFDFATLADLEQWLASLPSKQETQ